MNDTALSYAQTLIACESITPASGAVFDALEAMLIPLGFIVERFMAGEGDADPANGGPAENLFAISLLPDILMLFPREKAGSLARSYRKCAVTCCMGAGRSI